MLFVVLNASQGFFIFVFHVLFHARNRTETLKAIAVRYPQVTQWKYVSGMFDKTSGGQKRGTWSTGGVGGTAGTTSSRTRTSSHGGYSTSTTPTSSPIKEKRWSAFSGQLSLFEIPD